METIEKYQGQRVIQEFVPCEGHPEIDDYSRTNLAASILRRWRIVVLTFLATCAIGFPAVWFVVEPASQAIAAIRVAPVIPSILFGDRDSEGVIPMYRNFMNTQADLITSDKILQRVADDLVDKNLTFFRKPDITAETLKNGLTRRQTAEPVMMLRQSIINGTLTVIPEQNSELIKISMKSSDPKEAAQIVNSFVQAYMAIVVSEEAKGEDQKLTVLENERRVLIDKLNRERQVIREMAQEYGTDALKGRHEMMLQRIAALLSEFTKIQTRKLELQSHVEMLQQNKKQEIPSEKLLKMRHDFINADLTVQTLTKNITELQQNLIVAKQILAPTNPELQRKVELLSKLENYLDQHRLKVGQAFDEMITRELNENSKDQLAIAKVELDQVTAYENRMKSLLDNEDAHTIELGRKQLAIQDMQDQLDLTKDYHGTVQRRIQELEMERKRPARISVAYYANTIPIQSKRIKYTIAVMFASVALGMLLALLRDKADHSVYTPNDIIKRINVQVLGTTTRMDEIRKLHLPQQTVDDYQTILANIGLLDSGGIPKKLVITSAGIRDGKTTFAINFASSLAKGGRKVLLIDGDLRKPDIKRLLNLQKNSIWLQDILAGKDFESIVCPDPSARFDVLTAASCNPSDIYQLIAQSRTVEFISMISQKYDHLIIDSPPVLAAPDALLWAKMADAVVLTGFAGRTEGPDLTETLTRLAQINVKVLGIVLNNVSFNYSYHPYRYTYYTNFNGTKGNNRKSTARPLLLPMQKENEVTNTSFS